MIDHILKRIVKNERGCWIWQGAKAGEGYGYIRDKYKKKNRYVHILMWESQNGDVPRGLCVCHKCDTPLCCNPDHLFIGTRFDNMQDASRKRRTHRGEQTPSSKLKTEQVLAIRKDNRTQQAIAKEYSISRPHVSYIKREIKWAWL